MSRAPASGPGKEGKSKRVSITTIVVGLARQYNHRIEGVQMVMHLLTEELSVQVS